MLFKMSLLGNKSLEFVRVHFVQPLCFLVEGSEAFWGAENFPRVSWEVEAGPIILSASFEVIILGVRLQRSIAGTGVLALD